MTHFLYLPPLGKNKVWSCRFCDDSKLKFTVRNGRVETRKIEDELESNVLYCKQYPNLCHNTKTDKQTDLQESK